MISLTGCNNSPSIDRTGYYSDEVQTYLKEKCEFSIDDHGGVTSNDFHYHKVIVSCENPKIFIQKIVVTMQERTIMYEYDWNLDSLNNDYANILTIDENKKEGEKKQYEAYEKWLSKNGLSNVQIIDVLDYYDENN